MMYRHLTDGNNDQSSSLSAPSLNDNCNWNKVEEKLKKKHSGNRHFIIKTACFFTPNEWFYPLVLVVECLVVQCAAPRIVFWLISHVQQDFICSFPREMSKGWPTLKMVGKAMAHNPADVFHVLKTGELQQGCSLLGCPPCPDKNNACTIEQNQTHSRKTKRSLTLSVHWPAKKVL
jgi:hypothetical protein